MIKKINFLFLSMFSLGCSKYASGTVASFVTTLIFIFFYNFKINIIILILGVCLVFIYSVYSIDKFKTLFDEIDSSEIVIDEFVGQSIPILTIYNLIPNHNIGIFILYSTISFFLFRLFDITKPFPANRVDKFMKNGFGVMLDDVIAGIYSSVVLLVIFSFLTYE
jgi:phosphatidylglycerophosphatase A|tara:strand:- start:328 stop:822 length:495 start_codon:yes stop_codon:yes gene_type:complete